MSARMYLNVAAKESSCECGGGRDPAAVSPATRVTTKKGSFRRSSRTRCSRGKYREAGFNPIRNTGGYASLHCLRFSSGPPPVRPASL